MRWKERSEREEWKRGMKRGGGRCPCVRACEAAAARARVVAVEGRVADEHLIHDDAERPPVAVGVVARLQQNLGCHVVRRSDGRPYHLVRGGAGVREGEGECEGWG